jgi:hypothetical protein
MLLLCDSYPFSSNVSGQSAVSSIYSVNYIEYADGFEPMAACGNSDGCVRRAGAALAVPDECGRGYARATPAPPRPHEQATAER